MLQTWELHWASGGHWYYSVLIFLSWKDIDGSTKIQNASVMHSSANRCEFTSWRRMTISITQWLQMPQTERYLVTVLQTSKNAIRLLHIVYTVYICTGKAINELITNWRWIRSIIICLLITYYKIQKHWKEKNMSKTCAHTGPWSLLALYIMWFRNRCLLKPSPDQREVEPHEARWFLSAAHRDCFQRWVYLHVKKNNRRNTRFCPTLIPTEETSGRARGLKAGYYHVKVVPYWQLGHDVRRKTKPFLK